MQSIITQIADQLAPPVLVPANLEQPDADWFDRLLASAEGLDESGVRNAIAYAVAHGADEEDIAEAAATAMGYATGTGMAIHYCDGDGIHPTYDFADLDQVSDILEPYVRRYQSDLPVVDLVDDCQPVF